MIKDTTTTTTANESWTGADFGLLQFITMIALIWKNSLDAKLIALIFRSRTLAALKAFQ